MKRPVSLGLIVFLLAGAALFLGVFLTTFAIEGNGWKEGRIALIRVEGTILDARQTIEEILHYKDNPSVKAIVLRIDSPGGAVVPSQEIYEEIRKVTNETSKKVVSSMGSVAASGGYYIASASDRIVANPGTITGSIGVIMELADVTGLLEKIGVKSMVIKSGLHKDLASPFREMKDEEREILQKLLDDVHDQFIAAVAEGRDLPVEDVRRLADGRVFTGRKAMELGLVDELGDLQDTIQIAAGMAGIEGEPEILEFQEEFSWFDYLGVVSDHALVQSLKPPSGAISLKYLLSF